MLREAALQESLVLDVLLHHHQITNDALLVTVRADKVQKGRTGCNQSINRSINQLHVCLAREEPKEVPTPKSPLVIPNR
jgi:hypothetical protein